MSVTWRDDKFHDECGLFGIWNHPEAANVTYLGLYALQHRGQESAGIAATDGAAFHTEKAMGWVADVFSPERLRRLPGHRAIGHVRYSTAGSSNLRNAQPITATTARGPIAIAHNGNLTNSDTLRREMERDGAIFQSSSDTEVILHLLARAPAASLEEQIPHALGQVKGAYSLVILTPDALYAVRDPYGFRPLTIGRLGESWIVASETCALDLMEARPERDVEPGEMVVLSDAGLRSVRATPARERLQCVFEYVYFARPDSVLWGRNVHTVRKAMGRQLAREYPVAADIVIPVPDSGVSAALGYSEEAGTPYEMGLIRNHYVGRTFIEPKQGIRHFGVKVKLNPMPEMLQGRRVVVVDDSIVRGTTSRKIVRMVRGAGAREVHVRISSPPIHWPCYYGIDTPTRKELIASSHSVEEIARYLGADSLGYLSLDGLLKAAGNDPAHYCHACFTGGYRVGIEPDTTRQLGLFDTMGGPEMAPQTPQRSALPGGAGPRLDIGCGEKGGPEMAPQTPQRSALPGGAGPRLDIGCGEKGGPEMAPQTPQRSALPGGAGPRLDIGCGEKGGPEMAPQTPQRSALPGGAGPRLDIGCGEKGGPTPQRSERRGGAQPLLDVPDGAERAGEGPGVAGA